MIRLLLFPLLLMGFATSAQNALIGKVSITAPGKPDTTTVIRIYCGPPKLAQQPLFVVDGRIADGLWTPDINPNQVDYISVMEASAAKQQYGEIAKNGVILITTKPTGTGRQ